MSKNILQTILETKRKEVAELLSRTSLADLKARAGDAPPPRDFFAAVTARPRRMLNLIAEVKKASPSAGVICHDFDPQRIAQSYAAAGANVLSVLTDEQYFQGKLEYIQQVRDVVALPVLRKDFIIDAAQVYQSRAAGADAILLIAAALQPGEIVGMMTIATELRMATLLEVHSADELSQVRSMMGSPAATRCLLGVNNRDLATFHVDIDTTIRMAELAGEGMPLVSESGIKTAEDIRRLAAAGVQAVLVGETLMRSGDVAKEVESLLGPCK